MPKNVSSGARAISPTVNVGAAPVNVYPAAGPTGMIGSGGRSIRRRFSNRLIGRVYVRRYVTASPAWRENTVSPAPWVGMIVPLIA